MDTAGGVADGPTRAFAAASFVRHGHLPSYRAAQDKAVLWTRGCERHS
jgi:hypothetical protein